ncbi:MAG: hypothetical protein OEX07_17130, partial [Gammaproteobacteria bacterium]|nr:hypothetical protein [Gammaproteobacteria bacterium]
HWLAMRLAERVGLTGWIAWLLLITVALYAYYVFLPDQQYLLTLKQRPVEVQQSQQIVYDPPPAEQFFAKMPQIEQITSSIQILFDEAKKYHLVINEVIYQDEQKLADEAVRYSMTFSIAASYPEIKAFIIDTLAALPFLALEQLTFERNEVNSDDVSAHLRFTLYMVR